MCINIYIHIYIYTHAHIYTHTYMYTHAYIYIHTHIHIHICQETIPTAKKISMNLRTVCPLMSVTVCQEAMGKIAVVRWDQEDMYSWTHKTSTQIPSAFLSPAMWCGGRRGSREATKHRKVPVGTRNQNSYWRLKIMGGGGNLCVYIWLIHDIA